MYTILLMLTVHFMRNYVSSFDLPFVQQKEATLLLDGTCGGRDGMLMIADMKVVSMIQNKLTLYVNFTVKQYINYSPMVHIDIKRCKSKQEIANCDNFSSFNTANYCQLIRSDNNAWKSTIMAYKPPLKCPLKKGNYIAEKCDLDLTAMLILPSDDTLWVISSELRNRAGQAIMCSRIDIQFNKKKP